MYICICITMHKYEYIHHTLKKVGILATGCRRVRAQKTTQNVKKGRKIALTGSKSKEKTTLPKFLGFRIYSE